MAHGNPTVSLEVCNRAYEWNQMNPENCGGDEVEGYVELDYHKSCTPSIYQTMFSRKQTKKVGHYDNRISLQLQYIIIIFDLVLLSFLAPIMLMYICTA